MIEVEKKFRVTPAELKQLLDGAEFVCEKENIDIFFDLPDYSLSKKWSWLRDRNGRMELKVATHMPIDGELCETFTEYETEEEIRAALSLPTSQLSLRDQITSLGYQPFAALCTERTTYKNGKFIIDVDHTTAPDFEYDVVEIEQMVVREDHIPQATEEIITFAQKHGLTIGHVKGKLLEFIEQKNPAQFQVLIETGYHRPMV